MYFGKDYFLDTSNLSIDETINIIEELLPIAPSEKDIINYINNKYPEGIEKKNMGITIKEIKANFIGADGKLIADLVKNNLV